MRRSIAIVGVLFLIGCESAPPPHGPDADRILHMAGEEAGQIAGAKERFTRQLNIANRETLTGKPTNALITLGLARQTLEQAEKTAFTDQERLAGWISLCELGRYAEDKAFAGTALDQAMAALNQLMPESARCEYVPGIEREVHEVRGESAAASLLRTAADWAKGLPDQTTRRQAYSAFAQELFRCNDYEGARIALRHDDDAAWRSDTLIAMSESARGDVMMATATSLTVRTGQFATQTRASPMAAERGFGGNAPTTMPSQPFGKSLDFKSNYYRP